MKAYIYEILNLINNQTYIGQTTNFSRRRQTHIQKLKNNKHPNQKLQNAWNYYGKENFVFISHPFEVENNIELNELEIQWIQERDSLNNGYNLTEGGQGGLNVSPNKRKLGFEEYCIVYTGNTKYTGLMSITAKYFNCDSSTISAIVNKNAYLDFQSKYNNLIEEEKIQYLEKFEKIFKDSLNKSFRGKLTEDLVLNILCTVSTFSRGTESAIAQKFNLSKSFVINCFRYKTSYIIAKNKLKAMSMEEIIGIGKKNFVEWELNKINSFLKEEFTDLFIKYQKYV